MHQRKGRPEYRITPHHHSQQRQEPIDSVQDVQRVGSRSTE